MKHREKIFWLIVGATFFIGFIALIPAHYEICEIAEKTKEENCTAYRVLPFLIVKIGKILDDHNGAVTAIFTIVLAVSTIGLWIATSRLWQSGERQLAHLGDTAERELRAYIKMEPADRVLAVVGDKPQLKVMVTNIGQTPAYGAATWSNSGLFEHPLRRTLDTAVPVEGVPRQVINPNADLSIFIVGHEPLTKEREEGIRGPDFRWYFWGGVEFKDAFGKTRWARFCFEFGGEEGLARRSVNYSSRGNETSEG